jgi:hypothetical protein
MRFAKVGIEPMPAARVEWPAWLVPAAGALLIAGLLAAAPARAADLSGRDIIARMQAVRAQGDDQVSVYRIALITRGGARVTRTVALYRKQCGDGARHLLVFLDPADMAGAGFLTWSYPDRMPDMWLYLPELGRVRQMNAAAQGESFMGTDLTYEDLGPGPVDARVHRLLGVQEVDRQRTYRVESVPLGPSAYGKVLTWVSRETFLPVRVHYYDRAGRLLKIGRFRDVKLVKGVPTPFTIDMENVQTGHRTEIALLEADYDRGLECERLTKRHLRRAP